MHTEPTFKKCPFCGGEVFIEGKYVYDCQREMHGLKEWTFAVMCFDCDISHFILRIPKGTPYVMALIKAREIWNRRTE